MTDVEELGGFGLTGRVDGHAVAVGNRRLMEKLGIQPIEPQRAGTVVYVAVDGVYAGWILLGDVVKEHAAQAIRGLKAEGVEKDRYAHRRCGRGSPAGGIPAGGGRGP